MLSGYQLCSELLPPAPGLAQGGHLKNIIEYTNKRYVNDPYSTDEEWAQKSP